MQCLQQVCPAAASLLLPARSPQPKLLSSAPPGSCHLTLASLAGVRGLEALLPSTTLGRGGRGGLFSERQKGEVRVGGPPCSGALLFHKALLSSAFSSLFCFVPHRSHRGQKGGDCCSHLTDEETEILAERFQAKLGHLGCWVVLLTLHPRLFPVQGAAYTCVCLCVCVCVCVCV